MMDLLAWFQDSAVSTWLRESESLWALPFVLVLHTLGLAVLVGSSWAIDLRVLGVAREIPLEPLRAMFRLMWLGFVVNAASGVLLFGQDAIRKSTSPTFMTKMLFVAVGVITIVLIKRRLYHRDTGAAVVTPTTKFLAVASLFAWTAAITAGRLLAYIVEARRG